MEYRYMGKVVWQLTFEFLKNPIILSFFIIGILGAIFYKKIIGKIGEMDVAHELNKLPSNEYSIINNAMLYDENGKSHQIDHIVFSKFGIFVIETKNFEGLIKGNTYDKQWIQILGNTKNSFYNPVHQNYGHIKVLEEKLNIRENKFISIVCFSDKAKLNITGNGNVVNTRNLVSKIINEYTENIIQEDINHLMKEIETVQDKSLNRNSNHVNNIKKSLNEKTSDNKICPKCGGELVGRKGKYGDFLGCSNYPKCKYTLNLNKKL